MQWLCYDTRTINIFLVIVIVSIIVTKCDMLYLDIVQVCSRHNEAG